MPPKLSNVNFPALSFDAYVMLLDLVDKSGVDINQLRITGGSRTKEYNKTLPNSAEKSRHLHGDGIDFGGKANDDENKKLWNWLNGNSPEAKDFKDQWGLEMIGNYGDKHMHLGVHDGKENKGARVQALYDQYQPLWNQAYGANGMIDVTKISDEMWTGGLKAQKFSPELQSQYYTNGDKGITADRNAVENRGDEPASAPKPEYKEWDKLTDDEKSKLWPKYKEMQNRLKEVDDPATRKNIIGQYPELQHHGKEAYQEWRKHEKDERSREFREKYGIEDVEGRKNKIAELEKQMQGLVGDGDADKRKEVQQKINALEAENEADYLRAEREMYQDKLDGLQQRVDNGEQLNAADNAEYQKLRKMLPNEADRKVLYDKLAQSVGLGTDEKGVKDLLNGVLESGMHPQVWKETQAEFSKAYYAKHRENSDPNSTSDNSLNSWRKVNDFIGQTIGNAIYGVTPNVGMTPSISAIVNHFAPEWAAKQRAEDARYLHEREKAKDGTVGKFMWEEGMMDEWIDFQNKMGNIKAGDEIRNDVIEIPENIISDDEWIPEDDGSQESTDEETETDGEGEADKGDEENSLDGIMDKPFEYNPEEQNWYEKMGGAEGLFGAAMGLGGAINNKRIEVPEPEIIDRMLVSHIATVKRLSESGMDPVQQAVIKEGLDTSFNLAKKAIMDVASGSRGQALAGINSLSADRQKKLLDFENKKSANRQSYMKMYGDLLQAANDFSAGQENLNNSRHFELSKKRAEGSAALTASGVDQLLTAINTAKEYGKGSMHDMQNEYIKHRLFGMAQDEPGVTEEEPQTGPPAESATSQVMSYDAVDKKNAVEAKQKELNEKYPIYDLTEDDYADEIDNYERNFYTPQ